MNRWRRLITLAVTLLLHGCDSEAAPLWELVDPGGGGAAPAIYRVPDSDHLFVGSDVGGFRYSADAGGQFRVINEGLDFKNAAADNIQQITSYRLGDMNHVISSATAGLLYWRIVGPNGLGPAWVKFFDVRGSERGGAATLGALAVDPSTRHLYAGVGNLNNLSLNRLTELDPAVSGRVFIFRIGDPKAEPAPPQADGMLSLTSVCTGLEGGPYFHISDLAAVSLDGEEYLYVGTSEGLLIIRRPRSGDAACMRRLVPGRNAYVLAARPDARNPDDVVLLLNEGRLARQNDKSGASGRPDLAGGLFHTASALTPAPAWQDITPAKAQGKGLGKLERGRNHPAELVLSGDAKSKLGVIFTRDFSKAGWRIAIDRSFVSGKGQARGYDGWRRYDGPLKGVKEIAVDEADDGIGTIYVAGFQGMLLTGRRDGDDFRFGQSYTRPVGGQGGARYGNRGLPLMNPWRVFTDPGAGDRALFLYHDVVFFVSDDSGASFRRPVARFGWGTDVLFDPRNSRIFVAYSVGNHLESGRRKRAERGGILVGPGDAGDWQDIDPRLPEAGPVEGLTSLRGELCANVYRKGVFCTPMDGAIAWRRAVPQTLDVLHLLDVAASQDLWLVAAGRGETRRLCRVATGEPECSDLPADAKTFERLWFDAGRLWLAAKTGSSYSSILQQPLRWETVAASVADLRTVSLGGARIALIASNDQGLFVSRTPLQPGSWCQISLDGLNGNRTATAIADPAGGHYIYVAITGVGFYRASLDKLEGDIAHGCEP